MVSRRLSRMTFSYLLQIFGYSVPRSLCTHKKNPRVWLMSIMLILANCCLFSSYSQISSMMSSLTQVILGSFEMHEAMMDSCLWLEAVEMILLLTVRAVSRFQKRRSPKRSVDFEPMW